MIHFSKFSCYEFKVTNGRICFPPHVNEKFVLSSKIRPVTGHWASELKAGYSLEPC